MKVMRHEMQDNGRWKGGVEIMAIKKICLEYDSENGCRGDNDDSGGAGR